MASLGTEFAIWTVIPFVLLLLLIAILPLVAGHWWEKNKNKAIICAILALPIAVYLVIQVPYLQHSISAELSHKISRINEEINKQHECVGDHCKKLKAELKNLEANKKHIEEETHPLVHSIQEYISFIILLASLYVISGGIYLKGSLAGTPLLNTGFLALGGVVANLIGTTGASMLLIRPLLRANEKRKNKVHIIIFFIFVVSNVGGCLTPLGDPPLFLGFLRGVPFEWMLQLFPMWALALGILLVTFNIIDQIKFNKEELESKSVELMQQVQTKEPLKLYGSANFGLLLALIALSFAGAQLNWQWGTREGCMVIITLTAYFATPKQFREGNQFSFGPIIEVAVLFAGIFVTMIPALLILNARGGELGIVKPWQFFWATGILSSFLDNAPTYLTFTSLAGGLLHVDATSLSNLLSTAQGAALLRAISCGAVFMGANTYIGNGPNFMVKAIADQSGIKMPSFFGYMAWSGLILLPLFGIVTLVFFI